MNPRTLKNILVNQFGAKEVPSQPNEVRLNCFNCGDRKGHLYFNVQKGIGFCHRRGCVIPEKILLDHFGIGYEEDEFWPDFLIDDRETVEEEENPEIVWKESLGIFDRAAKPGLKYLRRRGLKDEDIKYFRFRYNLTSLPGCVIVPIFEKNKLQYWYARHILKRFHSNVHKPKGDLLFNFYGVDSHNVIVVEGVFDTVFMRKYAVGTLGKHLSDLQAQKIYHNFSEVTICYDEEAHYSTLKAAQKFYSMGMRGVYVTLLDYGDPGDLKYNGYEFIMDHRKKFSTDLMIMERYNEL